MSISPESSAEVRVSAFLTMNSVASSRLCSGLPHQFGFLTSTVLTSGCRSFSMKGPVLLALRVAKLSSFLVRSAERVVLFCSHHAFDMMYQLVISSGRIGSGD